MDLQYFREQHREPLREALVVAEDMTSDFFKLTSRHWLTARYDISTLAHLREEEISPHALAMVAKYDGCPPGGCSGPHPLTSTGSASRITTS